MLFVIYAECQKKALYAHYHYAECHNAECHYAECRYAECHYAECRYAECRYAECRATQKLVLEVSVENKRSCYCCIKFDLIVTTVLFIQDF